MNKKGKSTSHLAPASSAGKKAYRRPELRVFGAVHVLTRSTGSLMGDAMTMMQVTSDRGAKQNIVRIGEHPLGIGLYLFDYKPEFRGRGGAGRQFGVMADEVETVIPAAVSTHPDGHKVVNYALLGITPGAH